MSKVTKIHITILHEWKRKCHEGMVICIHFVDQIERGTYRCALINALRFANSNKTNKNDILNSKITLQITVVDFQLATSIA
uniref:Uncharacterized protein n=1 Tax=Anguilla anguilla TaxID=7936 RepID=A0A0E9QHZ4_ANGAN